MKNEIKNNSKSFTGVQFMQMLTSEELANYKMELEKKKIDIICVESKEYRDFNHFINSFHWGTSVKRFGYWARLASRYYGQFPA